jgi:hypothetical protein
MVEVLATMVVVEPLEPLEAVDALAVVVEPLEPLEAVDALAVVVEAPPLITTLSGVRKRT